MNVSEIQQAAEKMGVPVNLALYHRRDYLKRLLRESDDRIESLMGHDDPVADCMARIENDTVFLPLARELRAVSLAMRGDEPKPGAITDGMIEAARQYPITSLIDFNRGLAPAWCHTDRRPSLSHHKQANRAHCWPCGKSFDPIAVLMTRDSMTFPAAVRNLNGR